MVRSSSVYCLIPFVGKLLPRKVTAGPFAVGTAVGQDERGRRGKGKKGVTKKSEAPGPGTGEGTCAAMEKAAF